MATVNQEFPSAPMGRRVVMTTCLAFAAVLAIPIVNFCVFALMIPKHAHADDAVSRNIGSLIPVVFLSLSFLWERSKASGFSIEDNVLVIRKKRYPLQGLAAALRDREVMRKATRRMGNSGMGCIRGSFRSKRLGKFEAYLTDPENAVVLTWPDRVVAVSPADPEFFIYSARAAAGLR
jgi:hypothetical protein